MDPTEEPPVRLAGALRETQRAVMGVGRREYALLGSRRDDVILEEKLLQSLVDPESLIGRERVMDAARHCDHSHGHMQRF